MNLTDLTDELESRAHDVTPSPGMARLAAVRGRVRARRRRQAGAVALIAAGCALALAVGPNLIGLHTHSAPPAKSGGHRNPPFTFDPLLAGDPLAFTAVGKAGQSEVTLRFTPKDTNLSLGEFCYLPGNPPGGASPLWGAVTINGHSSLGGGCVASTVANGVSSEPGKAGWAELGVVPGRESVIRIRLQTQKGVPHTDPSVRLGVSLYELSGERITQDGFVIKLDAEAGGHDYRLVADQTRPAGREFRQWSLPIAAGVCPCYVMGGTLGTAPAHGTNELLVDGGGPDTGDSLTNEGGGGVGGFVLDKPGAHTLELRTDITSGRTMLAYYTRVD
jgi:hypothetical protein